jgi:3-hydroxybutyryl-CoA dehydrogenase
MIPAIGLDKGARTLGEIDMRQFRTVAIAGGGTMGADIALTFARAGRAVHVVEPREAARAAITARLAPNLADMGSPGHERLVSLHADLAGVPWAAVDLFIEAVTENLEVKRRLFAEVEALARPDALLSSNSSSFPIGAIAEGLARPERCHNLHYFMPAHIVPLVEIACGPRSDHALAQELAQLMRDTGKVPVVIRKDLPGFLANRLQHALAREAYALAESGAASLEDIDNAVRFGFGFRYVAAGPVLQKDHAGLDIHAAAAATMYPTLCNDAAPARLLTDRVAAGRIALEPPRRRPFVCGPEAWGPEPRTADPRTARPRGR